MKIPDETLPDQRAEITTTELENGHSEKKFENHAQTALTDVNSVSPGQIGSSHPFPRDPDP